MAKAVSGIGLLLAQALLVWGGASAVTGPQEPAKLLPGQVIERVVCVAKPEQSYALYLPANYSADRKWPVLYAFDPGARGRLPVEHYREAAEKYGWIVVGSNNSRNGVWQPSLEAWKAITSDTHQRFSIDDRRIYVAGFSGGARVAITFAAACGDCIAGVIASGAGFPQNLKPASNMRFAVYGTTGIEDFNFLELKQLAEPLARAGIPYHIRVFDGRHEWLPAAVALDALAWMELNAMASGRRERDEKRIDEIWKARTAAAQAFENNNRPYDAYQVYVEMSTAFRGLHDIAELEPRMQQLGESRAVRDAMRDEQQQIRKQKDIENQLAAFIAAGRRPAQEDVPAGSDSGSPTDGPIDADIRLHSLLADLRRQSAAPQDSSARRVARRVLEGEFIGLFERGSGLLRTQKQYDEAIRFLTLATDVNPDRAGAFYYLAWAYAARSEKKKALQALKTAIEKGFSDSAALNENEAFAALRKDPQYEQIVSMMKKSN